MRLPAMLLASALLTVAGCGSDVAVSQTAVPPVDAAASADSPVPATGESAPAETIPAVSDEHLAAMGRHPNGYDITVLDTAQEEPTVTLEEALDTANGPDFVGRSDRRTTEASLVRVTMDVPNRNREKVVVDRECWLVFFGGKAVRVPVMGPPPDPKSSPRPQERYYANWFTFVDAVTGKMITGGNVE